MPRREKQHENFSTIPQTKAGDMIRILFFVAFLGWLLIGWDFVLMLILDILIVWAISIIDGSGKKDK